MGVLTSELRVMGKGGEAEVIEQDSPRAVELFHEVLREGTDQVRDQGIPVLGRCPEQVERVWRERIDHALRTLEDVASQASRFHADMASRGLEFALGEAEFRGDLRRRPRS